MKRLIILVSFLLFVTISYAANKISMVTYFPVPYVAYSQVSVDNQLDVGLTTSCAMNLGCSESDVNLKAQTVNLQKGRLELNNGLGIVGNTLTLGAGSGQAGQIKFNNVRIQSGSMQSVNADSMNVKELQLFGNKFPSCKEKDASGEMKWQKLKLQGYAGTDTEGELYLTCGQLAESAEEPEPEEGECKLSWDICGAQDQMFDDVNCRCYEWYMIDRHIMSFAFAGHPTHDNGYKCLGEKSFTMAEKDTPKPMSIYLDRTKADHLYNLSDKIGANVGAAISRKTVGEMMYQCAFTKSVKIEPLPSNWTSMSPEEFKSFCEAKGRDTLFVREGSLNGRVNSSQVLAMPPRPRFGGDKGQLYCWSGLDGGAWESGGSRFPDWPCLGFVSIDFYGCMKVGGGWMFDGVADTTQGEWAPNESFRVLN